MIPLKQHLGESINLYTKHTGKIDFNDTFDYDVVWKSKKPFQKDIKAFTAMMKKNNQVAMVGWLMPAHNAQTIKTTLTAKELQSALDKTGFELSIRKK